MKKVNKEIYISSESLLKNLFPQCSEEQWQRLYDYIRLLRVYGQRLNLVSQSDLSLLWENHVIPSIIALPLIEFPYRALVADLGSGGGLPAIPLKIMRPDLQVHMIESSRRKSAFLKKVVDEIGLQETWIHNVYLRPKDMKFDYLHFFEIVTVRAVASMNRLIPLSKLLLKPEGFLLAWKGRGDLEELKNLSSGQTLEIQVVHLSPEYQKYSRKLRTLCLLKVKFIAS